MGPSPLPAAGPLRPGDGVSLAGAPLHEQVAALERSLSCNPYALAVTRQAAQLGLPGWYLGSGAVFQTVWNQLHDLRPAWGIKDYDLVYFDAQHLSAESERAAEERVRKYFADLGIVLDVKNEARVHLWYAQRYGRSISPYRSTEDAIRTWPTTASSVGVRYERDRFVVYAPFGLTDLFAMVVKPNYGKVDQRVYEDKAARWLEAWPKITVWPWLSEPLTKGQV